MVHLRGGSPTWPMSERAGELETLSVLPDECGKGIGTLLLEAVYQELSDLGAEEVSLHVLGSSSVRSHDQADE